MCHEPSARPPLPPISGGARSPGRGFVLEAGDGNRFAAHSVLTEAPGAPGIVILPDVRGLHPFYRDLALRFADAGVHATAIDYFGRTAGTEPRDDDFDYQPHVAQTRPDSIAADVATAVAYVRSPEGGGARAVFTVGFCFGGRNSFNQAARGHGLAGVIGFYGRVARRDDADHDAPIDLVMSFECSVLGLFGGADQSISRADTDAFGRALDEAGEPNEIVVYEGAPHSFFDRSFDRFKEACDDSWRRILRFIEANGGGGPD